MNERFDQQLDSLVEAYVQWSETMWEKGLDEWSVKCPESDAAGYVKIKIFNVFCKFATCFA